MISVELFAYSNSSLFSFNNFTDFVPLTSEVVYCSNIFLLKFIPLLNIWKLFNYGVVHKNPLDSFDENEKIFFSIIIITIITVY